MKNILSKLKYPSYLEWIFTILIIYVFISYILPYKIGALFGAPVYFIISAFVPRDAELGAISAMIFNGILLELILAGVGILFVKKYNHKFSYLIIFLTVVGFIFTSASWSIQSALSAQEYREKSTENNALGAQMMLLLKKCTVKDEKTSPNRRPSNYLVCNATLSNIPPIPNDSAYVSLEVYYGFGKDVGSRSMASPISIEKQHGGGPQDIDISIYLGEEAEYKDLHIRDFQLNVGFDKFYHPSIDLPLVDYVTVTND